MRRMTVFTMVRTRVGRTHSMPERVEWQRAVTCAFRIIPASREEFEPAEALVEPEMPDDLAAVVAFLGQNPPERVDKKLPNKEQRQRNGRRAPAAAAAASAGPAAHSASVKASFQRPPKRKRGENVHGEPLPVPAEMPPDVLPQGEKPRGLFNYTIHGQGDPPASINVQLRAKAFFINRVANGTQGEACKLPPFF